MFLSNVSQCHALFCEESLGKIDVKDVELFWNELVHEFYCLKALICLEQVNTSVKTGEHHVKVLRKRFHLNGSSFVTRQVSKLK